jgi:acetyl esterase/lipase
VSTAERAGAEERLSRADFCSAVLDVPLQVRVRLWLQLASWLTMVGFYPSMETMPSIPLAKRKASRPPKWLTRPISSDVVTEDIVGSALGPPESIRLYRPQRSPRPLPLVLFMHGGGFVNGGLDSMQFLCGEVASTAPALVVSVDYPLAPEAPYPAALDACYRTLCWLAENGEGLGGDSSLTVMGDSAGGNLAAALCLLSRRESHPRISRQILIYPALDATLSTPRMRRERASRRRECDVFYRHYAGDVSRGDELVSPLLAPDVGDLPPATIITADNDALQDDGRLYADRLVRAGISVRYTNYLGMPHGFLSMPRLCSAAPQALAEIASAIPKAV